MASGLVLRFTSWTAELLRDDDCVVECDAKEDMRRTVVREVDEIAGYGCSERFVRMRLQELSRGVRTYSTIYWQPGAKAICWLIVSLPPAGPYWH